MAKLVLNPGTPHAREFALKPGANYLGRGFANDVKIEDDSVSGTHAQIEVAANSVTVKDLGSTNGTFINRTPVTEAALLPGQSLRLGGVEMIFESDTQPAMAALPPVPPATLAAAMPPIGSAAIGAPSVPGLPPIPRPVQGSAAGLRVQAAVSASPESPRVAETAHVPAEPPNEPELIELPTGKSACKYHPRNPAQWLCEKCKQPFCSLCVATRQTAEGTGHFCRTCGSALLAVKVKYVAPKEKGPRVYSDVTVLLRSLGFGFAAAILAATVWAFLAGFTGVMFLMFRPFLCWGTGGLCGYAVKLACQDRPSIVFSLIAAGFCLLGVVMGAIAGVIVSRGHGAMGVLSVYTLLGLMFGMFTAWKIGGGDF